MIGVIQYTEQTGGTLLAWDTQQDLIIEHNAPSTVDELEIIMPMSPLTGQSVTVVTTNGITDLLMTSDIEIVSPRDAMIRIRHSSWYYSSRSNKWLRLT